MFKKRSILAIIVTIMVAGTSTFGTLMYLDRRDYRIYLQNQYQRNLYNLISQVENLQVSLSKVNVAGTPRRSLLLFGDVWKDATAAQSTLNALPISHVAISQTSKFLTQVGDYSYYLMKTSNSGSTIGTNEWNNIEKLRDYAGYLSLQLHQLDQQFQDKGLTWEEIKHGGRQVFINTAQNPVDMNFQTYRMRCSSTQL
jgi:germination protein YpeB